MVVRNESMFALLPHVRLRHADAGDALLELGVDGGDASPRACAYARGRPASEPDRRDASSGGTSTSTPSVSGQLMRLQHDQHADEAHDVHERGDEPGLQQLRERVDVGGHAGHDPARHLAVVVVEREPLQVGEDPDAQREQQPLGGAAGVPRVGPRDAPSRRASVPRKSADAAQSASVACAAARPR